MNETFYQRCTKAGLSPQHVCEVGVWKPESSNVLGFISDGIRTTLVEADPDIVAILNATFYTQPHVTIVPNAVYVESGELEFFRAESSTFAKPLSSSPALKNDSFQTSKATTFRVNAVRFDEIDDGTIDVLSIDVEGCDWYVLQYMQSRPKVVSIETGIKHYVNPFLSEISTWMNAQNYVLWYRDKSDSVYVRKDVLQPTFFQRIRNALGLR